VSGKRIHLTVLGSANLMEQVPEGPCEHADDIGICTHEEVDEDFLCNQGDCPWPERKSHNAWWAKNGGTITEEP
jgi:hypothetical protein